MKFEDVPNQGQKFVRNVTGMFFRCRKDATNFKIFSTICEVKYVLGKNGNF